jgi:hypothetical protein
MLNSSDWDSNVLKGLIFLLFVVCVFAYAFLSTKNPKEALWLTGTSFAFLPLVGLIIVGLTNSYEVIDPRDFAWTFALGFGVFGMTQIVMADTAAAFRLRLQKNNRLSSLSSFSNQLRLTPGMHKALGWLVLAASTIIFLGIIFDL